MPAIRVSGKQEAEILVGLEVKLHYVGLVLDDGKLADGTVPRTLDQWAALGFYATILGDIYGLADKDEFHLAR